MAGSFWVEVAYALPERQRIVRVEVAEGATVRQAIEASRILASFEDIELDRQKVGIFGKLTGLDAALRSGDRIEIYRPLIADPKETRKQRARKA